MSCASNAGLMDNNGAPEALMELTGAKNIYTGTDMCSSCSDPFVVQAVSIQAVNLIDFNFLDRGRVFRDIKTNDLGEKQDNHHFCFDGTVSSYLDPPTSL